MKSDVWLLIAALMFSAPAFAAGQHDLGLIAMGPDPGGKSGQGVTPSSTATDHPAAPGPQGDQAKPAQPEDKGSAAREGTSAQRQGDAGKDSAGNEK
jgi:hypothetical protein